MRKKSSISGYSIFVSVIAAFAGLLFGYHSSVISGAILFISEQMNFTFFQEEIIVSTLLVGALLGAILGGLITDNIGRKNSLFVCAFLFIIGTIFLCIANSFSQLLIGRFIVGIGIGIASLTAPLYISEMAPTEHRGALVSINQLAITFGILLSYGIDYFFSEIKDWREMFAFSFIPTAIFLLGLFFIPETPTWLAGKGRRHKAEKILRKVHRTKADDTDVILEEKEGSEEIVKWSHLFEKSIRPALLVGIGISIFQQITGINTIIYYAPRIFQFAGFESASIAILATMGLGAVNFIMTIIAIWIIDIVGRKPLLLIGLSGMVLSLGTLAYCILTKTTSDDTASVVSLMFYVAFFAISIGPIAWLIISEIYPAGIRGRAMGIATFANWVFNYFVSLTFLSLLSFFGVGGTFLLYAIIGLFAIWFVYKKVPETKGKTFEQIQMFWKK